METLLELVLLALTSLDFRRIGLRLKHLKTENPKRFWVVIGLCCWTVFVVAAPWLLLTVDAYRYPIRPDELIMVALYASLCFCPGQVALTAPGLVVCVAFVWERSTRAEAEEREHTRRECYEAAKRYHQTRESLTEMNLSSTDLRRMELSKADLRQANLAEANLEWASLVDATLVAANLSMANLSNANLQRSDLSNTDLYGANLRGASLEEATLDQADIRYANLREVNLQGAVLCRANLQGADLWGADLQGADLQGADLAQARLAGATLDDSTVMPDGWEDVVKSRTVHLTEFSPMPEEFADFVQMLEEAKAARGTLICFECGHHNPVGESQCEECGAWVPQTAKARWAHARGK